MKLILIVAIFAVASADVCQVASRGQLSLEKTPVLFTVTGGKWELAEPTQRGDTNTFIDFSGKTVGLACPGEKNVLTYQGKEFGQEVTATCKSEGKNVIFNINGQIINDAKLLKCKSKAQAREEVTTKTCNNDGILVNLGFRVKGSMHTLITACHRLRDGTTYYSKHTIQGGHFPLRRFTDRAGDRPYFHSYDKALYKGFPAHLPYVEKIQKDMMSNSMGSNAVSALYDKNKDKFFSKGHLAPNADFVLDTWRDATFLFVNTQPQWQQINGYNWNEIETASRKLASRKGIELEVLTGTDGVLKPELAPNKYGNPMYLGRGNTHPVPEYFWKVVRNPKNNQCIGFVSNNFPLQQEPKLKCNDVCAQNRWPSLGNKMVEGYVYCCTYAELKKAFPVVPSMQCTSVLQNS